jgi:hypothetical protein
MKTWRDAPDTQAEEACISVFDGGNAENPPKLPSKMNCKYNRKSNRFE